MRQMEKEEIVESIVKRFYMTYPNLLDKFGEKGKVKTKEDNYYHIEHLETAFALENTAIFIDYTLWLNEVLTTRGVATKLIIDNYQWLIEAFQQMKETKEIQFYIETLEKALLTLREM